MEYHSKLFYNLYSAADNTCFKFIRFMDEQITKNLRDAEVPTRPVESNGLWCCVLLPVVLNLYSFFYNVSPVYKLTACLSLGLLCYSLLFITFLSVSSLVLYTNRISISGGCVASCLVATLVAYTFLDNGLPLTLLLAFLAVYLYGISLKLTLVGIPKTFTIGEAMVVLQGVVLFTMAGLTMLVRSDVKVDDETHMINVIVYTVLLAVAMLAFTMYLMKEEQRTMKNLSTLVMAAAVFVLIILHASLGKYCIWNVLKYLFSTGERTRLFMSWLTLLVLAVSALYIRTHMGLKASTGTRKIFHVLASLVFMSGILLDEKLMTLAAGGVFGVIIFVEALRKSKIDPISSSLQSTFSVYRDEKDSGELAVTPIYLFVGLACPLALVPTRGAATSGTKLELLSGVLSIGIGDAAASWFGSKYGKNKWTGSEKTVEGTVFNVVLQVATVYVLVVTDLLHTRYALFRTIVAATVSSLVEAKTDQVDNLLLPLITLIAFQLTTFWE